MPFSLTEGGAAGNGCDQTYHGPTAFSEDESANVRDAILSVANGRTQAYLTVHSYGQYWLTPWGYTTDLPEDYPQLVNIKKINVAVQFQVKFTEKNNNHT